MASHDSRARSGPPTSRAVPDLRIANYDLMERDIVIEITDSTGESVYTAEQHLARGANLTQQRLFPVDGAYEITVSLRYGSSTTATHTVTPGRTGLCLDIHPDGIDSYATSR